jgi:hypothetical protein
MHHRDVEVKGSSTIHLINVEHHHVTRIFCDTPILLFTQVVLAELTNSQPLPDNYAFSMFRARAEVKPRSRRRRRRGFTR